MQGLHADALLRSQAPGEQEKNEGGERRKMEEQIQGNVLSMWTSITDYVILEDSL